MEKTRISLCMGDYAKTPYCVKDLTMEVSCLEELCYLIYENAYLLDMTFMDLNLADWLENECGLKELAGNLRSYIRMHSSLSNFATAILEYSGVYEDSKIKHVDKILKDGSGLSGLEKRKKQVDFMLTKGETSAAIKQYDMLLIRWEEENQTRNEGSDRLRASILHNRGSAYAFLYKYKDAAASFWAAYEAEPDPVHFKAYLSATKLYMSDTEYLNFISGLGERYEHSLWLERHLMELYGEYENEPDKLFLNELKELKTSDKQAFYAKLDKIADDLKKLYRESTVE